jgi:hypothetical protein
MLSDIVYLPGEINEVYSGNTYPLIDMLFPNTETCELVLVGGNSGTNVESITIYIS